MKVLQKVSDDEHKSNALVILGEVHEKRGEWEEALDAYQQVGKGVRGVQDKIKSIKQAQRDREREREIAEARKKALEQKAKEAAEAELKAAALA